MNNKRNAPIRSSLQNFILEQGPYLYHVTFTTAVSTSDIQVITSFNFLIKCLNRALFGHNYSKNNNHLGGSVFAERQANSNIHFHVMISSCPLLEGMTKTDFESVLQAQLSKVKTIKSKRPMFHPIGVQIDYVSNSEGLIDYLTKTMKGRNYDKYDFYEPLTAHGIPTAITPN